MTIQFQKPLSAQEIFKHIQERIEDAKLNYSLWKIIQSECNRREGQTISKRIETAIKKVLPDYTIYYSYQFGMFHLVLWGNGIEYEKRKTFYLGYDNNPVFSAEQLLKSNMSYELELSRAEKLATLPYSEIVAQADQWNNALAMMQAINQWAEPYQINYTSYGFDIQR
jgi:hypothetical protein